ncbi:phage tail tape measure protein-like protein [Virus Rctr71]|nr:phage tail tape measure protein-like protein [Virus Rctr71]
MTDYTDRFISTFQTNGIDKVISDIEKMGSIARSSESMVKSLQASIQSFTADPMVAAFDAIARAANRASGSIRDAQTAQQQMLGRMNPAGVSGSMGILSEVASYNPLDRRYSSISSMSRDPAQFRANEIDLIERTRRTQRQADLDAAFGAGNQGVWSPAIHSRATGLPIPDRMNFDSRIYPDPRYTAGQRMAMAQASAVPFGAQAGARQGGGLGDFLGIEPVGKQARQAADDVEKFNTSTRNSRGPLEAMGNMIGMVARAFLAWTIIQTITDSIGRWITVQKELNDTLADYMVMTGESRGSAERYLGASVSSALLTGVPITDAAMALQQTRRVGAPDEIAMRASELQRISGLDAVSSARELISIRRQFPEYSIDEILDRVIGALQKSTFTGPSEIFETLKVAGPTTRALNTDLAGYLSLVSGATTVTSLTPSQVELGTRRIANQYSDEDSSFRKQLDSMGIAVDDGTGKLRDFVDVFFEIADGAESGRFSMAQIEKLASTIPNVMGTAFGEMFIAMIQGGDSVEAALESTRDSAGKWEDALVTKMDTVGGAAAQLSVAWDMLMQSLGGSELMKWILGQATGALVTAAGVSEVPGVSLGDARRSLQEILGKDGEGYWRGAVAPWQTENDLLTRYSATSIRGGLYNDYGPMQGERLFQEWMQSMAKIASGSIDINMGRSPYSNQGYWMTAPMPRDAGLIYPEVPGQTVRIPQGADMVQVEALYAGLKTAFEGKFGPGSVEEQPVLMINQWTGELQVGTYNLAMFNDALSQASVTLQQQVTTLPAGVSSATVMARARQIQEELKGQGYDLGKDAQVFFRQPGGGAAGVELANPQAISIALSEIGFNTSEAKRLQAEANRIAERQISALGRVADGIVGFTNTLLSPTPVTAVDMFRTKQGTYTDKFDEPVRRLRADINNRMQNKPLEYGDTLAQFQALGYFPMGIKDVTGTPEEMQDALRGQLAEAEDAFYNLGLPLDFYDMDTAVKDFEKHQERRQKRRIFNENFAQAVKDAGVTLMTDDDLDAYLGRENKFVQILFGDLAPQEVGETMRPYTKAVLDEFSFLNPDAQQSENLGLSGESVGLPISDGIRKVLSDTNYTASVAQSITVAMQEETNIQSLFSRGTMIGRAISEGILVPLGDIADSILAEINRKLAAAAAGSTP